MVLLSQGYGELCPISISVNSNWVTIIGHVASAVPASSVGTPASGELPETSPHPLPASTMAGQACPSAGFFTSNENEYAVSASVLMPTVIVKLLVLGAESHMPWGSVPFASKSASLLSVAASALSSILPVGAMALLSPERVSIGWHRSVIRSGTFVLKATCDSGFGVYGLGLKGQG